MKIEDTKFDVGDRVRHPTWGECTITGIDVVYTVNSGEDDEDTFLRDEEYLYELVPVCEHLTEIAKDRDYITFNYW